MNLKDKQKVLRWLDKGNNDKLKTLINEKPELLYATNEYDYTLLEIACHNNNLEAVQFFLEKKLPFGEHSAFLCASHGYSQILMYLIDEGIISKDIKDKTSKYNQNTHEDNLLMVAASCGHINLIDKFMEKGIHINEVNNKGHNALYLAMIYGEEEMVEHLIVKGINTDFIFNLNQEEIKVPNEAITKLINMYQEKKQMEESLNSNIKSSASIKI